VKSSAEKKNLAYIIGVALFTNIISDLAVNVASMMEQLGYKPHLYQTMQKSGNIKYTVRLSRNVEGFIQELNISKR
jgi:uncharacterized protein with PhoU and TrkA domain